MITTLAVFGIATTTSALLTPVVRRVAPKLGALDLAISSRKVHVAPIPRLGGAAIVLAFFAPLVGLFFVDSRMGTVLTHNRNTALGLFVGGAAIALLGVYDDLRGTDAKLKFTVQFGAAILAYAAGYRVDVIANPFGAPFALGWFGLPFTLVFVVGITNAINLIDGLDGLAGGVALVAILVSFVAAAVHGDLLMMIITASLAGATLGFLFYNFNPASIFMGDTGSMFLGFILAISAIKSHQKTDAVVSLVVPLIAMGLPIVDTLLAIARRAARGLPLFRGDREHIHHRLLATGLSHRAVVLILYATTAALGATATLLSFLRGGAAAALIFAIAVAGGLLLRRLGYLPLEALPQAMIRRRKNIDRRRCMGMIHAELQHAEHVEAVWASVGKAMPIFNATSARLEVVLNRSGRKEVVRLSDGTFASDRLTRTRHGLLAERLDCGFLELGWSDSQLPLSRDIELAIEALCGELLGALQRVVQAGPSSQRDISIAPRSIPVSHAPKDVAASSSHFAAVTSDGE